MNSERYPPELRKKNIRVALALGALAIIVFITSIPFWEKILTALGSPAV